MPVPESPLPVRRRLLLGVTVATAATAVTFSAGAQTQAWPSRPVRIIVPFGAGSTPDVVARIVGEYLTRRLGQAVIVENRAGAGGNLGTDLVAKAAPDGYTIGLSITGPLVNNTVLYKRMPYDPFKDLAPLTQAVDQPAVLVVTPALGVKSVAELLALLRRNPGKYNYASIGAGSVAQLSIELIKWKTGTYIVHVPYRSSPEAVTSILQGDTQMAALAPLAVMPHVKAGKLVALGVTTRQRSPYAPGVPTFGEAGIPEVQASAWMGFVAPSATPQPLRTRIADELIAALKDPAVVGKLDAVQMTPVGGTPEQFAAFMRDELKRWSAVIKRAGVTIDG